MTLEKYELKDFVKIFGFSYDKRTYCIDTGNRIATIQKTPTDKTIQDHLNHVYSISLPRFDYTKIFCFDVDCKDNNQDKTKNTIMELVNIIGEPFFIEKSIKESGGYHLYYKFNKSHKTMSDEILRNFKKWFEDKFKDKNYVIEPIYGEKKIKLPFSEYYKIFGNYNSALDMLVDKQSIHACINNALNAKEIEFNKKLYSELKPKNQKNRVTIPDKINKQQFSKSGWTDYSYGAGNRYINQCKIAARAIFHGLSLNDFIEECKRYDCGSRDMIKWRRRRTLEKNLESIYRFFEKKLSKNTNSIYNKNVEEKTLSYSKYDFITVLDTEIEHTLKKCFSKMLEYKKNGKCKDRFINDSIKLYKLIISLYKNKPIYTDNKKYDFLNQGVLFNDNMVLLAGKELQISNSREVFKFLKLCKLIKAVKDPKNNYEYCYRTNEPHWAKHYMIISIKKFIKFVKRKIANNLYKMGNKFGVYLKKNTNISRVKKEYNKIKFSFSTA